MSVNDTMPRFPSDRILQAIAVEEGTDPIDLDPPLFDVVDGELLDSLLESNAESRHGESLVVRFAYLGYAVTVTADGDVDVRTA